MFWVILHHGAKGDPQPHFSPTTCTVVQVRPAMIIPAPKLHHATTTHHQHFSQLVLAPWCKETTPPSQSCSAPWCKVHRQIR